MKYIRPFCKLIPALGAGASGTVNFTDTAGNNIECNYIEVGIAGSVTTTPHDTVEIRPTGIGGAGYAAFSASTAGLGAVATPGRPAVIHIPNGSYATGVDIYRVIGSTAKIVYINYGVLKEERNPLKANGKFKGL